LSDDRCDATADDLIDVVEGNRTYVPCIYLLNKIDQISIEELGKTGLPIFKLAQKKYAFNATLNKRYWYVVYPFVHIFFSRD
jgi:ribosome-interacting GTPase 1